MGIDVFKLSCKEFFSGHFKTMDFFVFGKFSKKNLENLIDFSGGHEASSSDSV
jgi:hypothetical protein